MIKKIKTINLMSFFVFSMITAVAVFLSIPLAQADSTGLPDLSYGDNGVTTLDFGDLHCTAYDAALQNDGKLVLAGYTGMASGDLGTIRFSEGSGMTLAIARLNTDGSLDSSFAQDGLFTYEGFSGQNSAVFTSVKVLPDGKILASGYVYMGGLGNYIVLMKLNADGTPDITFGKNGISYNQLVYGCPFDSKAFDMEVLDNGKILVAGRGAPGGKYQGLVVRYNADGTMDSSFNNGLGYSLLSVSVDGSAVDAYFLTMQVGPDKKIYCAGKAEAIPNSSGMANILAARFQSDGTVDTSFGSGKAYVTHSATQGNGYSDEVAYGIAVATNGKIYIAGDFYESCIMRLKSTGEIDTNFGPNGTGFVYLPDHEGDPAHGSLTALKIFNEEKKIVVSGWIENSAGVDSFVIARLNTDGTLDSSFGSNNGQSITGSSITPARGQSLAFDVDGDGVYVAGSANNDRHFAAVRYTYDHAAVPGIPDNVLACYYGTNGVVISWHKEDFADQYVIWRANADDRSSMTQIGTTRATSYTDTLEAYTNVYYWVTANNGNGSSNFAAHGVQPIPFSGGVSVNGASATVSATVSQEDTISINIGLAVGTDDQGQAADIIGLAGYQAAGSSEIIWFLRSSDVTQSWSLWNGDMAALTGYRSTSSLGSMQDVDLYKGTLLNLPGTIYCYGAYRLKNGAIIWNNQPVVIHVSQ